jgi:hypothetical protein
MEMFILQIVKYWVSVKLNIIEEWLKGFASNGLAQSV